MKLKLIGLTALVFGLLSPHSFAVEELDALCDRSGRGQILCPDVI